MMAWAAPQSRLQSNTQGIIEFANKTNDISLSRLNVPRQVSYFIKANNELVSVNIPLHS